MTDRRDATRKTFRLHLTWTLFWSVSALGVATVFIAAFVSGGRTAAATALLFGLIAVGIASLLFGSIVSPRQGDDARLSSHGGWAAGGAGGVIGSDAGFGGGGDGGGGSC